MAQENGSDEQDTLYALNQKSALGQLIRNGDIDAALSKLCDWYPQIVQDEKSTTCFLLHCQKFMELVWAGALEEAVKYGRSELEKFFGLPIFENVVQTGKHVHEDGTLIQVLCMNGKYGKLSTMLLDCPHLLALGGWNSSAFSRTVLLSPFGHLLAESQREMVADTVNAMILSTNPNLKDLQACLRPYLERLLRQLTVCCLERRSLNGDQGEAFHLQRVLNSHKKAKC